MTTTLTSRTVRLSAILALLLALVASAFVLSPNSAEAARISEHTPDAGIGCYASGDHGLLTLSSQGVVGEKGNPIGMPVDNVIDEVAYSGFSVYRWEGQWVYQGFSGWQKMVLTTEAEWAFDNMDVAAGYYYAAVSYIAHDFDGEKWQYSRTVAQVEEGSAGADYYAFCG